MIIMKCKLLSNEVRAAMFQASYNGIKLFLSQLTLVLFKGLLSLEVVLKRTPFGHFSDKSYDGVEVHDDSSIK